MLNLAAAVGGTVAAHPTSLNFGTGGGAVHGTLQLTLTNVGTASDTYTLQVHPTGGGPAPSVAGSLSLDAAATRQVPVTLDASGLAAGEYQGYLVVTGASSSTAARIPYWFAVPGSTPAGISILYQDFSDPARSISSQAVVLRVVDVAGLPYTGPMQPRISVSGSGSVRSFYRAGTIPGTYAVDVRTGTSTMQLTFVVGTVSQTVIIPVN
jgi:hypothetical protein